MTYTYRMTVTASGTKGGQRNAGGGSATLFPLRHVQKTVLTTCLSYICAKNKFL